MGRNEPHSTRTRAPGELELEPVASTKLSPPRGARLMPRDALLARMLEARRKRCLLLQGPAGCGKTSMLVSWRQALMGLDIDIAWLSLSAEDNELGRFFDCLLASLAQVDPAIVREVAYLVGHGSDASAVEHWVIKLVQGVSSRARELVLIVDDLHHVDDPRVAQALQWLLDYAPPNLHLAIGSRAAVPFATARLRAQEQLAEFDLHDLRFSREESERFLRERLESIDTNDARSLHELTDGWVAGLQLYAVDLKTRRGGEHARVQLRDARAFADYFEREVVVHIAPDDLNLLTRVALCNRFCASLSAALLGEPHALARMTTRLVRLDRDNLFISQVSAHDQETWYRLHPLLREVLQARAAGLGDDAVRALHGTAWRWFSAHGYIDEAVRHAVQAGELAAATDLVEACAEDLLARGALSRLAGLMRRLPDDHVQASFRLLLMTAYLQMHARDLDGLRASLRRMERNPQAIDQPQRYRVSLLRGGLAMQCDDTDAVQAIEAELLAIPDDADPIALAGRSHVLAWMFMYRGEFAKAEEMLEQGARYSAGSDRHLVGRCLAGMRLTLEGRMGEAEGLIRETLREAERPEASEIGIVCAAAGLLGEVLYEFDELEAVCSLLEDRIGVLERISIPDTVLRAMVALSGAQWLLGQRAEAVARMEEARELRHPPGPSAAAGQRAGRASALACDAGQCRDGAGPARAHRRAGRALRRRPSGHRCRHPPVRGARTRRGEPVLERFRRGGVALEVIDPPAGVRGPLGRRRRCARATRRGTARPRRCTRCARHAARRLAHRPSLRPDTQPARCIGRAARVARGLDRRQRTRPGDRLLRQAPARSIGTDTRSERERRGCPRRVPGCRAPERA